MRAIFLLAACLMVGGCVTGENVRFVAKPQQEALMRDGQAALVSRKKNSLVLVRPAARQFALGARPVFVVAAYNLGRAPIDFRVSDIAVTQLVGEGSTPLKVVTYEDLVNEERTRQVVAAILTGVAAAGNAYSASRQGYYSSNSTVYTPRATYQVHTTGYSPTANAIAQANASAQNEAMIAATIERGQQNLAALEQGVIKDNTLLPGEWYGGQLHIAPPSAEMAGPKRYTISMLVGNERHEVDVQQEAAR